MPHAPTRPAADAHGVGSLPPPCAGATRRSRRSTEATSSCPPVRREPQPPKLGTRQWGAAGKGGRWPSGGALLVQGLAAPPGLPPSPHVLSPPNLHPIRR